MIVYYILDAELGWDNVVFITTEYDLVHKFLIKRGFTQKQIEENDTKNYVLMDKILVTTVGEEGDYY